MAFSRYERVSVLNFGAQFGTSITHSVIRNAVKANAVSYQTIVLHDNERLDQIAGKYYGNSRYWWIIAAASDIGWGLQVPPNTIVKIPNLAEIAKLVA